jgi:probable HAF family extracellular repeat protein
MTALADLPGGWTSSFSYDLTPDGSVIVGSSASDLGHEAVRWDNGVITSLGDLPGGDVSAWAYGISDDGLVIVGSGRSEAGTEAFRWENGVMTGLGDLPGGVFYGAASDVSADGSVVVGYSRSESGREAFRWENDVMSPLGDLPGVDFDSWASAVSADGSIIVGRGTTAMGAEVFIWDTQSGMRNLREMLVNEFGLDLSGWRLKDATGISPDGLTIVGFAENPDGNTEAWIAQIPCILRAADFDVDCDVDLIDYDHLGACLNGPDHPPALPDCGNADLDGDGDVDLREYATFQYQFTG